MLKLRLPLLLAEGPGPVEIVTALAEDVQKARQCKCRSASRAGHNPDSSLPQAACQLPGGTAITLATAEQLLMRALGNSVSATFRDVYARRAGQPNLQANVKAVCC